MRISKKILAIALSILMVVSMMPFTVFAAPPGSSDSGTGASGGISIVDPADEPTVTWDAATENIQIGWDANQSNPYDASYTKDAITVSATSEEGHTFIDGTRFQEGFMGALSGFVFTNSVANFSKIKLVFTDLSIVSYNQFLDSEYNADPHWSSDLDSKTVTWEGDSNSVGLYAYNVSGTLDRIEFTYEEPAPAEPVSYKDAAYDTATNTVTYTDASCEDYIVVAADTTTFEDGKWYVVNSNVTVNGRITVNGAANLILADGYTLTVTEGVAVTDPSSLTIFGQENGTGTLTATGGDDAAGIGGIYDKSGPITINGGTINATGDDNGGAGIGASDGNSCGNITINGGTVNAYASGSSNIYVIGDAGWSSNGDGTIAIHGGTVNVNPGEYTYGIGYSGNGTINITGGVVNVNKDKAWATGFKGGNLNVSGGEVYAAGSVAVMSSANFTGGTFIAESIRDNNPAIQSSVSIASGLKVLLGSDEASATEVEPSFINYNSSAYWNANPKWIKIYPAPAYPTATITDITDTAENDKGLDKAYKYVANDDGHDFDGYRADFVVTFDEDVAAGDFELWGKFGSHDWTKMEDFTATAGQKYYLLRDVFEWNLTYADVISEIGTFLCGFKGDAELETKMNVALVIYDAADPENTEYTVNDTEYTIPEADKSYPTATITDITETADNAMGLNKAYKYEANNDGHYYDNYRADFVVTFDEDVVAGDFELWGKFGSHDWTKMEDFTATAGQKYYLLRDVYEWNLTYADVLSEIGTFYCGFKGDAEVETKMNVALVIYDAADPENTAYTVNDTEYTIPEVDKSYPTATITDITETADNAMGLNKAYKYEANNDGHYYDNYRADFVVTFDEDVVAGDFELWGKFGSHDWTKMDDFTATAGQKYYLLRDVYEWNLTYADVLSEIGTFYCGVKGDAYTETKMNVALVIYDAADPENTAYTVNDTEYTIPAVEYNDKLSITTDDKIDLNFYIDPANVESITVSYNSTPDAETNTPATKEISGAELEAIRDGDFYKVVVPLAPAQIRDEIQVTVNETIGERRVLNYSIADYCNVILAGTEYDAETKALAQATLDYGKAASDYFGYNTAAYADYTIANPTATFGTYGAGTASGITITSVSYVAKSVPELRFTVSGLTEAKAAEMSVSSNIGEASFAKLADGTIVLQVTGIPAALLGQEIQITGDVNVSYTPLRWAQLASQANNAELSALGNAVGNYAAAAAQVFSN